MFKIKPLTLFIFFIFFVGCVVVPITGRKQFSLISSVQLLSLSQANYKQILEESEFSQDFLKTKMIERVGNKIASATEQFLRENNMADQIEDYQWEFKLIEDDENVNAFCMPGGRIGVYTGILEVSRDDVGMATVLAHEIAHAIANHAGERMSHLLLVELGEATLADALNKNPGKTSQIWMLAYGIGTNVGIILPYSRTQELEADRIGLILMAKAGYDPRNAISFWKRMNEKAKSRPVEFLSTHPVPERRMEDIRKAMPEALEYYRN